MTTALAKIEPIPAPDLQRTGRLTSLPEWVERCSASLKKAEQPDETGRRREMPVLPRAMMPTQAQRVAIGRHLGLLGDLFDMTPANHPELGAKTAAVVTKMALTLAGREGGQFAAEAKGEAYNVALEDLPFWAVEEVARRWYRGEYGEGNDYRWMPGPAKLRELAELEMYRVRATARKLRTILNARPELEYDAGQSADMRRKLAGLGIKVEA